VPKPAGDHGGRTTPERDDAFGSAMIAHGDGLARLAYFLCGDRHRAEDLVAEAFAAVWPRWSSGRVDELLPYLRRTLVNLAAKDRRHRFVVRHHDERATPAPTAPAADHDLWLHVDLAAALRILPAPQRVVVVLRYLEDMTEAEMATLLAVAPGTVKSRLSRGLFSLRQSLQRPSREERRGD